MVLFWLNQMLTGQKNAATPDQILKPDSSLSLRQPLLNCVDEENHLDGYGTSEEFLRRHPSICHTFSTASSEETAIQDSSRSKIDPRIISDAILGLSDGLTVPFALSAGLSALGNAKVVVLGGLAELTAGAISMGLGGYVGATSEGESYQTIYREVCDLIERKPGETHTIIRDAFATYGLSENSISEISASLHSSPDKLREFLITFHYKETEQHVNRAYVSAITLALGYFVGGFIPLIPYFWVSQVVTALYLSMGVMAITLFVFGYIKTCIVRGWRRKSDIIAGINGGVQMCLVGGVAAGAAVALVRAIDHSGNH